jgi:hypothetical protein
MERCGDCACYGIGLCPKGEKWGRLYALAPEVCFVEKRKTVRKRTGWRATRGSRTPARGELAKTEEEVRP